MFIVMKCFEGLCDELFKIASFHFFETVFAWCPRRTISFTGENKTFIGRRFVAWHMLLISFVVNGKLSFLTFWLQNKFNQIFISTLHEWVIFFQNVYDRLHYLKIFHATLWIIYYVISYKITVLYDIINWKD